MKENKIKLICIVAKNNLALKGSPFSFMVASIVAAIWITIIAMPAYSADSEIKRLTITAISDADSLRAGKLRLRLHGIDAPELRQSCFDAAGQPYKCGQKAKNFLQSILKIGAQIDCQHLDTDRYRRLIVRCFHRGQDIAGKIVRAGWALAYRRYAKDYIAVERQAARSGQGIWQGKFTPPEKWRRQQR